MGQVAGFQPGQIFTGPHFRRLLSAFLGESARPVCNFTGKLHFRAGERFQDGVQLEKIIGLMTDAWVRRCGGKPGGGYHLSDRELLALLQSDPQVRARSKIDPETVQTFIAHARAPLGVRIHRFDGVITLEDALEPFRVNLEHRRQQVPAGD